MYIRRRIGRRRSFFQKHRILVFFMLGAVICTFAYFFGEITRGTYEIITFKTPVPGPEFLQNPQPLPGRKNAIVYPYSVIPGGVQNREELEASMRKDKVVAAHFADFKVDQARIVRAAETAFVHVSYRIKDNVYWTAKTIKIPKGETLITDGKNLARTRCGNRVSASPQPPTYDQEPDVESFDIPQIAREGPALESFDLPQIARLEIPDLSPIKPDIKVEPIPPFESRIQVPHPNILPYYYRPLFVIRANEVVVPEPSTFILLGGGLAVFSAFKLFRKK